MTNIDTQPMFGEVESGPEQALATEEDDPHFIFERDGWRCQVCGTIGHPKDLEDVTVFGFPLDTDRPLSDYITICEDCWLTHTSERLDEYVAEAQERRQEIKEHPGDYEQNREQVFERDDHTCQLCGEEGYPKAERGLVAYPVCAGDYHLDNLVTVCNDCITDTLDSDEDDQKAADRLRLQAARAKEWMNSDEADSEHRENTKGRR